MNINYDVANCFLMLLKYAITGKNPPQIPHKVTAQKIYDMACRNNLRSVTAVTLNNIKIPLDTLRIQLIDSYRTDILINSVQQNVFNEITCLCEKNKISIIPCVSLRMKILYPMTSMCCNDGNDFFVHAVDGEQLKQLLIESKFVCMPSHNKNVMIFRRDKFETVRIFTKIIDQKSYGEFNENVWKNTVEINGFSYVKDLCMADLYVIFLEKAFLKYQCGKFTFRVIFEEFLLLYNYSYVCKSEHTKSLILSEELMKFKELIENLAQMWFSGNKNELESYAEMLRYVIYCGESYSNNYSKCNSIKLENRDMPKCEFFLSSLIIKQKYPQKARGRFYFTMYKIKRLVNSKVIHRQKYNGNFNYKINIFYLYRDEKRLIE